ncbi:MAG TPA: RidA family protein [Paracoccaceae bacterium]|nr:RidA family protein [Paracoccaceae bacterium]
MRTRAINAPDGPQTPGTYAQAVLATGAAELLFISGQIGVDRDGVAPPSFEEQARLTWHNIDAQLRAAGMTKANLVKVTIFLADRQYIEPYRRARDAYLGGHQVALTCIVTGIFDHAWLMEIEAVAAR